MFSSLDASLVNSLPDRNELHSVEKGGAVLMVGQKRGDRSMHEVRVSVRYALRAGWLPRTRPLGLILEPTWRRYNRDTFSILDMYKQNLVYHTKAHVSQLAMKPVPPSRSAVTVPSNSGGGKSKSACGLTL